MPDAPRTNSSSRSGAARAALDPAARFSCAHPPARVKPTCSRAAFCACSAKSTTPANRRHHFHQSRRRRNAQPHSSRDWKRPRNPAPRTRRNRPVLNAISCATRARALAGTRLESPRSSGATTHLNHRFFLPRPCLAAAAPLRSRRRPRHQRAAQPNSIAAPPAAHSNKSTAEMPPLQRSDRRLCFCGATTVGRTSKHQLVAMLEKRDQWMHDFVLDRDSELGRLRARLERPSRSPPRPIPPHLATAKKNGTSCAPASRCCAMPPAN